MKRELLWALGATLVLVAATLWFDSKPAIVVAATARSHDGLAQLPLQSLPARAQSPLPVDLEPLSIEVGQGKDRHDIFVPVEPPAPKVVPLPVALLPQPEITAPVAPPLNLRYLGSMVTPAGERLVMLARDDASVPVQAGTRLEEGYVVRSIDDQGIHLVYPPLGTTTTIYIPPAPTDTP